MSDRDGTLMNADGPLAAALRALPDAAPEPDLWPELARTLARRRQPRHRRSWLMAGALAAGIGFVWLLSRGDLHTAAPPAPPTTTLAAARSESGDLTELRQRSQALERWIAAFPTQAPQDSRDLMAAVEVEDLIGLVDVQLEAARSNEDALPLWQRRVALLEDLATIRGNAFTVAARDESGANPTRRLLN